MSSVQIRSFNAGGTQVAVFPAFQALEFTQEYCDTSAFSFDYPLLGESYASLTDELEMALFLDGVELPDSRGRVTESSWDPTDEAIVTRTFQVESLLSTLKEAKVYPKNWPSVDPPTFSFVGQTAGKILVDLFAAANARGVRALTVLTYVSFSATVDSNSVAWGSTVNLDVKAGDDLYGVLGLLRDLGLIEFRMSGRALQVYKYGTMGTNRSTGASAVLLAQGRDLVDAPISRSAKDLASVALIEGDAGSFVEYVDAAAVAALGRREVFATQSTLDTALMALIGQTTVDLYDHARQSYSHEVSLDGGGSVPWTSYFVGDTVLSDATGVATPLKIRQLVLRTNEVGVLTAGVALGDKFEDLEIELQRKLAALTSGTGITGSGPPNPNPVDDGKSPGQVTGLTLSPYVTDPDGDGKANGACLIWWAALTLNDDGSTMTDLRHYEVRWKYTGQTDWSFVTVPGTVLLTVVEPLRIGKTLEVRVRAIDETGREGALSTLVSAVLTGDITPPPVPSTPVVTAYLGQLKVVWNGLSNTAGAMTPDTAFVEVHASTSALPSSPTTATMVGTMTGAGTFPLTGLTYATTYNVKLVSRDRSGNRSAGSVNATGVPAKIVNIDIGADAVQRLQILDGEIVTAKIEDLAVNDAKIANLSGGKIDALSISADRIGAGVLQRNQIVNPGFEDTGLPYPAPGTYSVTPGWTFGQLAADTGSSARQEYAAGTVAARSGGGKLRMLAAATTAGKGCSATSDPTPIVPGQTMIVGMYLYGSGTVTVKIGHATTKTGTYTNVTVGDVQTFTGQTVWFKFSSDWLVPSGRLWAKVIIEAASSGSARTAYVCDCWFIPVGVGSSELTAGGLRLFDTEGEESVSILSGPNAGGAFFQVRDSGDTLAEVGSDGKSAFQSVSTGELDVGGLTLAEWFTTAPRGVVAFGSRADDSEITGTGEKKFLELQADLEKGRNYRIYTSTFSMANPGSGNSCTTLLRFTNDGTMPGITDTILARDRGFYTISGVDGRPILQMTRLHRVLPGSGTEDFRCLLTFVGSAANAGQILGTVLIVQITIEDVGPYTEETGIDRGADTTSSVWKVFTKDYGCQWSQAYEGNGGTQRTGIGNDLVQGRYSGTYGNQKAAAGFNSTTIRGDIDFASVTVIDVNLYMYFYDWADRFGTVILGSHGSGSAPANWTGLSVPNSDLKRIGDWRSGTGKWVNLGDASFPFAQWKSGANKGIIIGPGPDDWVRYYGKAKGATDLHQPVLRIKYKKKT